MTLSKYELIEAPPADCNNAMLSNWRDFFHVDSFPHFWHFFCVNAVANVTPHWNVTP